MDIQRYKRGQIWWLKDDTTNYSTHLQMGTRPVIIISNDVANKFSSNITIIPCTTADKKDLPTHLALDINEPSTALGECITTVSNSMLSGYIGTCDDRLMNKVDNIIQIALGLKNITKDTETVLVQSPVSEVSLEQILGSEPSVQITESAKRGRKPILSENDKQRLLNDYETHNVDYMLKKYNIRDKKALQQKIYMIRKQLGLGVRTK